MKFIKNHLKFVICMVVIVILSVYTLTFGIKLALNNEIFTKPKVETKIYSVWHIETFEGGGKSRILFLKDIAKNIEKQNIGVLFNIKQISPENLENELKDNKPDIFSFGYGVGDKILPYLINLDNTYSVRDSLIESGSFNAKLYAIPYMVSGYALLTHSPESVYTVYGENGYTKASIFNKSATSINGQYEAYKRFVNNKNYNLIGTARDVFRVENLNNIGRTNATISALTGYTDLIQYAGITSCDYIAKLFIENLVNKENQLKLTDYSLFSSLHTKLYTNGIYNDMENAIFSAEIPNVFYE